MSIAARLTKAEADFAAGDFENALIQALIAVAATSKKRYPQVPDGKAFRQFLKDDFSRKIQPNIAIVGRGFFKVQIDGALIEIEDILYKHVRCHLLHEAQLPPQLCFIDPATGFSVSYEDGKLQLGQGIVEVLVRIVREAIENCGS